MKFIKIIFTYFFSLLFNFIIYSQESEHQSPTLQIGLDGLNFSKGTLDPEIIARIISQKQSEIKLKVIQNSFLRNIYGSGGTIYNYADNVIKGVVQEPDTDVRTKKIMESTVNLVFVYTFADFYLKQTSKNNDSTLIHLRNLANGYRLPNLSNFSKGLKYRALFDQPNSIVTPNSNLALKSYKGLIIKSYDKDDLNRFMSLIIDISSEVVRNNDKLRDLGLMRVSYSSNYDYLNLYKQQQNYSSYSTHCTEYEILTNA